jgi:uncharacterized protein YecE (DUF72 family)
MQNDQRQTSAGECRILVGTSGYAYTEWADAGFYPPGTRSGWMLPFYARHFCIVELNYTWYQMPKAEAVERQRRQVPPGFQFAAKLTRTLTHEIDPQAWLGQAAEFRDGMAPLIQESQLAAVLVQFPPGFTRSVANRRHLAALLDAMTGLPLAVEFRHRSWATDRVFEELERRRVTLVTVDEPDLPGLFPALDVVTNPELFYVRFHGRNTRGWRSGNMQQQFDYSYTDDELQEWIAGKIEPMCAQARQGLLFFNNHVRAQATANARQTILLLNQRGLTAG